MGIPFSIPCDPCVNKISGCLDEKIGYIQNLEKNLKTLEKKMEDLKVKQEDLSRKLRTEEDRGAEFNLWLSRVEDIKIRVTDLLSDRDAEIQKLCLCGLCSKNLLSSYRYGKKVCLEIREGEELHTKVFNKIVDQASEAQERLKSEVSEVIDERAQSSEVEERQLPPIIVGQETMLEKAWRHLMKDEVGIMGMYGMGGVGKTTLLTQINNKFCVDICGFDFVIWVVVSQELHVERIQDQIAEKVGLLDKEWNKKDKSKKGLHLFKFLREKRFVLILDDIWKKVDLAEIGVPFPTTQNKCKVAFTTRSQVVCKSMGAKPIMEVQCLAENEAFDLFQKKVGQETLERDPGIPALARVVAKKCCGLPLALKVIGETMSSKKMIQEWKHAIDVLNSYAAEFSGMEDKILPLLKYSYDSLKGEHIKLSLLYCALYPEDYRIRKTKLIEYWIGEGIIDGSEGIERAENKGYDIIGSLVSASLLIEEVNPYGSDVVSMHDVVREMALWIASDLGIRKEAFIVHASVGLDKISEVKNWKVVRRMSLMHNRIEHLAGSPKCPVLTTLLLQEGSLSKISSEFFKSMPKLVVLDLSGNESLYKLPKGISNLISLQYLNLSCTDIRRLPKNLQKLKKLIHLDLEYTRELKSIAGISKLHNLKVLKLSGSGIPWDLNTVKEVEALEHLEILTIKLFEETSFLGSQRLMICTQSLEIRNLESSGISLPETMDKLRDINIFVYSISEIKMGRKCSFLSLSEVCIAECRHLMEVTFLMFAPNLRTLKLNSVDELEDIINKEKACEVENSEMILPFPKLRDLRLCYLQKLKSIYWSPLSFPCLEKIYVSECPNLKNLPLDSKSGKHGENGLIIKYEEKEWIEGVEWEDEATKTRFLSSCQLVEEEPFVTLFSTLRNSWARQATFS